MIKGSDQLLLDGYRYRRDRLLWRCVKANCKGRARCDGITCKMDLDHICQALDPNEIEKALFNYEIKKKARQCYDLSRLIIHEARLKLSSNAAIIIPQCTALQRTIQRVRQDNDIPTEPKIHADIVIPPNLQSIVTNQKVLLYDNNDHRRRFLIFASKEQLDFLSEY